MGDAIAAVCPQAVRSQTAGLREVCFGELQGKTQSDPSMKQIRDTVFDAWRRGEFQTPFPSGEDLAGVMARGIKSLTEAADLGSTVIVVAHGGFLKWCAVALLLSDNCVDAIPESSTAEAMCSESMNELMMMKVKNCCCSTLFWDPETRRLEPARWFADVNEGQALDDTG